MCTYPDLLRVVAEVERVAVRVASRAEAAGGGEGAYCRLGLVVAVGVGHAAGEEGVKVETVVVLLRSIPPTASPIPPLLASPVVPLAGGTPDNDDRQYPDDLVEQ